VCCIDGSLFPVISSMLWAAYTTHHQALKLHLCFGYPLKPGRFAGWAGRGGSRTAPTGFPWERRHFAGCWLASIPWGRRGRRRSQGRIVPP